MAITQETNYDYLIDKLRLHLWDVEEPYRYLDMWLRTALAGSIAALGGWWNYRYELSEDELTVSRSTSVAFIEASPPIIQKSDERAIILRAGLIIKSGTLENLAYNLGSWKDAEIAYSNIQAGKSKESSIAKDWEELENILTPPRKRLVGSDKIGMPGFIGNDYESSVDF